MVSFRLVSGSLLGCVLAQFLAVSAAHAQEDPYFTGDRASTTITTSQNVRVSTGAAFGLISARIARVHGGGRYRHFDGNGRLISGRSSGSGGTRNRAALYLDNAQSGASAGGASGPVGVWASYARTNSKDTLSSTAFDSDLDNVLIGVDFVPMDNAVAGIAIGYENNDVVTKFNAGGQDIDGVTIAPYFSYLLDDNFSIDVSGGISNLSVDQFRTVATARVSSSLDSDRRFLAANLNYFRLVDNWSVGARFGVLYAVEDLDGFTESNGNRVAAQSIQFGQWQFGGDLGYAAGSFEPYVSVAYEKDFEREDIVVGATQVQPDNDDDDFRIGVGVRYFGDNGVSGILQYDRIVGREDFESDTFSISVRAEFD